VTLQASKHQCENRPSQQSVQEIETPSDDVVMSLIAGSQSSIDVAASSKQLTKRQAYNIKLEIESGMTGTGKKRRALTAVELEQREQQLSLYKSSLTYGKVQEVVEAITDTVHERADVTDRKIDELGLVLRGQDPNKASSSVSSVYTANERMLTTLRAEQRTCKRFMKSNPSMTFEEATRRMEEAKTKVSSSPPADDQSTAATTVGTAGEVREEPIEQLPKRRKATSSKADARTVQFAGELHEEPIEQPPKSNSSVGHPCVCGKVCTSAGGLTQHKRACKAHKEHMLAEDVD
jgi:hypothetical protein